MAPRLPIANPRPARPESKSEAGWEGPSSEARSAEEDEGSVGSSRRRLIWAALIASALPLAAQAAAPAATGRAKGGGGPPVVMDAELAFSLIASLLTLSEEQQRRLRVILEAASADARPLAVRLDAMHDGLFDAVKAGDNDNELTRLAGEQGYLQARLLALQAQAFARLWQILTPEQKAAVEPRIFSYIGELLGAAAGPSAGSA